MFIILTWDVLVEHFTLVMITWCIFVEVSTLVILTLCVFVVGGAYIMKGRTHYTKHYKRTLNPSNFKNGNGQF